MPLFFIFRTLLLTVAMCGSLALTAQESALTAMQAQPLPPYRWEESAHSTRYFFGPAAYNLYQGEGYYQNSLLLINQVSYGFSDQFSAGVGVIPLFLFGLDFTPVWATPKLSFTVRENKGAIGMGGLMGGVIGERNTGFGILYGIGTLGNRDRNTSLGIGYGYAAGNWGRRPAINWSGLYRVGNRWALQTENYYISVSDSDPLMLLSFGARWMGPKIAIDFGLIRPVILNQSTGLIGIPWVSITAPFGRRS